MRLNSLRQLTLVSFALVLVPLTVLVGYSQITLSNIAKIASSEAEQAIRITRNLSDMESLSLDMERLARQFTILKNDALLELINRSLQQFYLHQEQVCAQIIKQDNCVNLKNRASWLAEFSADVDPLLFDAQLAGFRRSLADLVLQVNQYLDLRIQQQQMYVSSVQQNQIWLIALLSSVSLLLIGLGSRVILRPIEKIERIIGAISQQKESLPTISHSGPRELIFLEHQLHNLALRLSQLENLRKALLRHASHELKTPLASIKEGCSLLTDQVVGPLNEQQKEVLGLLNSSTERLNLLIVQLLDYNLLLQQAKPDWATINAKDSIQTFVEENSLAIKQHNNQLKVAIENSSIYTDVKLFRRILDNLLSNAIAHGRKGGDIFLKLYHTDQAQIIEFSNKGNAIPEELRDTLFQPFYRGQTSRNDRVIGSGLGLSIVADCARIMFGKVQIVDIDNWDVSIRITLPKDDSNES